MVYRWLIILFLSTGLSLPAAERLFDFSETKPGSTPAGFRSTVTGEGSPGDWQVVGELETSPLAPADARPSVATQRLVLAQVASNPTDEHFPLLIYERETFGDFRMTTRFKTVAGRIERMAGLAFRIQDETNYYVVRASSLGRSFRFYKFVQGRRSQPVGAEVDVPSGTWHELTVECTGNRIRCLLNGQQLFPDLTDNSFSDGRIGFWTKSDSVSYFADARIVYTAKESVVQQLVADMMKAFPRLRGLQVYAGTRDRPELHVVASHVAQDLGAAGGEVERKVLNQGVPHWGRESNHTSVVLPLRDRNGESAAVARFIIESRPGQTERNALARVNPVVQEMEKRIRSSPDLTR